MSRLKEMTLEEKQNMYIDFVQNCQKVSYEEFAKKYGVNTVTVSALACNLRRKGIPIPVKPNKRPSIFTPDFVEQLKETLSTSSK